MTRSHISSTCRKRRRRGNRFCEYSRASLHAASCDTNDSNWVNNLCCLPFVQFLELQTILFWSRCRVVMRKLYLLRRAANRLDLTCAWNDWSSGIPTLAPMIWTVNCSAGVCDFSRARLVDCKFVRNLNDAAWAVWLSLPWWRYSWACRWIHLLSWAQMTSSHRLCSRSLALGKLTIFIGWRRALRWRMD